MTHASSVPAARAPSDITNVLAGRTRAWGLFEDRFGRVRRRFDVVMNGHWDGDTFLLDEEFVYDTGDTERRVWRIVPEGAGRFRATCPDCVGEAVGTSDETGIRIAYRFKLAVGTRLITVDFDDRIHPLGQGRAVNRATMRKWGIKLGELSLFFQRESETGAVEPAERQREAA